jgi:hypothetical protein
MDKDKGKTVANSKQDGKKRKLKKVGDGKNKGGRPSVEFDEKKWNEFELLCQFQCTKIELCEWFGITDKTLDRLISGRYKGKSFSDVFAQKRVKGLISLRRRQFQLAENNVAMAIFLGKNYLQQSDKMEWSGETDVDIVVKVIE